MAVLNVSVIYKKKPCYCQKEGKGFKVKMMKPIETFLKTVYSASSGHKFVVNNKSASEGKE